jgi:Sugar-binding N-terminal domain
LNGQRRPIPTSAAGHGQSHRRLSDRDFSLSAAAPRRVLYAMAHMTILADDLTGAADCALPAVRLGARVTISLVTPDPDVLDGSDVVAWDLDSRRLARAGATVRMGRAARSIRGEDAVYINTESVPRRDVGASSMPRFPPAAGASPWSRRRGLPPVSTSSGGCGRRRGHTSCRSGSPACATAASRMRAAASRR